jgi:hypothetical protein
MPAGTPDLSGAPAVGPFKAELYSFQNIPPVISNISML